MYFSQNKCVKSIFLSESIFLILLLLKKSVFLLNNRFPIHLISAVDIKRVVEFLQLICDFLTCGDKVRSSVYIFLVLSLIGGASWSSD